MRPLVRLFGRALLILAVLGLLSALAPFLQLFAEKYPNATEAALESVLVLGIFLFLKKKPALLPIHWEPGAAQVYRRWLFGLPLLGILAAAFIRVLKVADPFEPGDWPYILCFAPVIEELFFRQVIFDAFMKRGFGLRRTALWSGALFGIYHLQGLFLGRQYAAFILLQSALACVVGVVFAWCRGRSGSLLPGMALHLMFNAFYLGASQMVPVPGLFP